jgi:hypothetical protein
MFLAALCQIPPAELSSKSISYPLQVTLLYPIPNILKIPKVPRFTYTILPHDRFRGLVVRVPDYRSRGPGFESLLYQIF